MQNSPLVCIPSSSSTIMSKQELRQKARNAALMPTLLGTTGLPHLGRIGQRELLSVALPGALSSWRSRLLVASPADVHRHGGFLKYASSETSRVNTGVLIIAILLGAISAYGVGLVLRMYIWRLFEHLPRGQKLPRGVRSSRF